MTMIITHYIDRIEKQLLCCHVDHIRRNNMLIWLLCNKSTLFSKQAKDSSKYGTTVFAGNERDSKVTWELGDFPLAAF